MKDKDKSKEEFRKQFTEQCRHDEAGKLHAQADRLADTGNFRDAIDTYTRLLQVVQIYEAYTNRGACYTRVEQYKNAERISQPR